MCFRSAPEEHLPPHGDRQTDHFHNEGGRQIQNPAPAAPEVTTPCRNPFWYTHHLINYTLWLILDSFMLELYLYILFAGIQTGTYFFYEFCLVLIGEELLFCIV